MWKIGALVLIMVCCSLAADVDVSLSRATAIAQAEFPGAKVSPKSVPPQPVVLESGAEYWVVEFDAVWVPIAKSDGAVEKGREKVYEVYLVHYSIQRVMEQYKQNDYPSRMVNNINLLQSDVRDQEGFLTRYKPQLPEKLHRDVDDLVSVTSRLSTSVSSLSERISALDAQESKIINSKAGKPGVDDWKSKFSAVSSAIGAMSRQAGAYDSQKKAFLAAAQAFKDSENTTAQERKNVLDFESGVGIGRLASDMISWGALDNKWKERWYDVTMEDEVISDEVGRLYSNFVEATSQVGIDELMDRATAAVEGIKTPGALKLGQLKACLGEISPKDAARYNNLNDSYFNAFRHYERGREAYLAGDYAVAKDGFLNAVEYAGDAKGYLVQIEGVACGGGFEGPGPKSQMDIIQEFLASPMGILAGMLIIALVVIFWWNKRKGSGYNEQEYVPDYY